MGDVSVFLYIRGLVLTAVEPRYNNCQGTGKGARYNEGTLY